MAIFNRLFAELFKSKAKRAHSMLLIQAVAVIAMVVISFLDNPSYVVGATFSSFFSRSLEIFSYSALIFVPVFYVITCFANERTNRSQTFRLTPIKDGLFYADNILSSFVALAYYGIMDVLAIVLLSAASYLTDANFHKMLQTDMTDLRRIIGQVSSDKEIMFQLFSLLMLLILASFLVYFLVSFLNFSSSAILDFLPEVSSRAALRVIRGVLIVLIAWLLIKANDFLRIIITSPIDFVLGIGDRTNSGLGLAIIIMLAIDLVFLTINIFIFGRFFETREKN